MALSEDIKKKAYEWAESAVFDTKTKDEIKNLINSGDEKELSERFYRDLAFGTGGLRGVMGAGTARMNVYNVRRATYALASYLRELYGMNHLRVAITFDSRLLSEDFARTVAEVLASQKIEAIITKNMRPVPMLSFMVRHFQCAAGVCVTASHNPPEYNGYKVYWHDGGQLVPPHDDGILEFYQDITSYEGIPTLAYAEGVKRGLIREVEEELDAPYFEALKTLVWNQYAEDSLKIVYSPIHGTGIQTIPTTLALAGFTDLHLVKEQATPDGRFPTVESPNPEDPRALEKAKTLGLKLGADLVLGTDPDCDRLGVMCLEKGGYNTLNGNDLGSLLIDFTLASLANQNKLPEDGVVINTIVTTDMQAKIAASYGVSCESTLTGFKWICDLTERYENGQLCPKKNFICGTEESYGFLAGTFVRDKDAAIGALITAQMLAHYKSEGQTLSMVLDRLYRKHGIYKDLLETLTLKGQDGAAQIQKIMQTFRASPPKRLGGAELRQVIDYKTQKMKEFDPIEGDDVRVYHRLPRSDVLQFFYSDKTKISLRPSGTEPKIKVYISTYSDVGSQLSESAFDELKVVTLARAKNVLNEISSMLATI